MAQTSQVWMWPAEEPFPHPMGLEATVWILGAGRFGRLAVERLFKGDEPTQGVIVDADPHRLREIPKKEGLIMVRGDVFVFLSNHVLFDNQWIIPAVPVHVALGWIVMELGKRGTVHRMPVPHDVDALVPHPIRTPSGTLYASHAAFRCPDDCPEPEDFCTITKKPRPEKLYQTLQKMAIADYGTVVIQSRQLAPGVGGYTGEQLKEALSVILRSPGAYLVATSCSCHAVMDALRWDDPL
ncbi:MAG: hypothetical protein WHS86_06765 [Desulfosoma sp.]